MAPAEKICPTCQRPDSGSSKGSITQWLVSCHCNLVGRSGQDISVHICSKCGKRIGQGRKGSITQLIFRSDLCRCDFPQEIGSSKNTSNVQIQLSSQSKSLPRVGTYEDVIEEPGLTLKKDDFPLERYHPIKELGRGWWGCVYLARDKLLNKLVAVKVLQILQNKQLVAFQEEAKITSRLNHPNILTVLDFGIIVGSKPFIVFEYFQGRSLAEQISKYGPLDWTNSREIFIQACKALIHAYNQGVLHRDITPSNILFSNKPEEELRVKLIDFGIAKVIKEDDPASIDTDEKFKTGDGANTIAGTPLYMCPDQAKGLKYDSRSEVYSLGCVIFETLTAKPPFQGSTSLETIQKHANSPIPKLQDLDCREKAPPQELEQIQGLLEGALAKEPEERIQTVSDFLKRIESIEPHPESYFNHEEAYSEEEETEARLLLAEKRRRTIYPATAAILVLPIALLTIFYLSEKTGEVQVKKQKNVTKAKQETVNPTELITDKPPAWSTSNNGFGTTSGKLYTGVNIIDEQVKEIADKPDLTSLQIALSSNFTGTGLEYLKNKPITSIEIKSDAFNDRGAIALKSIPNLRFLKIFETKSLGMKGMEAIMSLRDLQYIRMRRVKIPPHSLERLINLKKLTSLDLSACAPVTDKDIETVVKLPKLNSLELGGIPITQKMIDLIASSKTISILNLEETNLDDSLLEGLLKMPSLQKLDIEGTMITDPGLDLIAKNAKHLTYLEVSVSPERPLTENGISIFKRSRPEVEVRRKDLEAMDSASVTTEFIDVISPQK